MAQLQATHQLQQPPHDPTPFMLQPRDTYLTACTSVPEDDVLNSVPTSPTGVTPRTPGQQRQHLGALDADAAPKKKGLAALLGCSCFGGGGTRVLVEDHGGHPTTKLVKDPSLPRTISITQDGTYCHIPSHKVSRKGSTQGTGSSMGRRWTAVKRVGSLAYSDADWFDAQSNFDNDLASLEERDNMMAEVDQLVKELAAPKGHWIPDTPLTFGVANMHFVPLPEKTGFAAYWMRDEERTTPPPQPIDVMLKNNWIVQKSHNSIPGVFFEETADTFNMTVKPRFVPPGFPRYQEYFDKKANTEMSWALRRDLSTGRSYGKIYMTSDHTLILRVHTRPMFGNDVDIITEEYCRLEEDGQVIVARQCCLDVKTGKRAVQYLVGRRYETPPKGHI